MSALIGIQGYLLDAPEYGKLRSNPNGALIIEDGLITEVGDYDFLRRKPRPQQVRWLRNERCAVFPGLVDLNAHVPHYSIAGRSRAELLSWVREKVFPAEREFTGPRGRREATRFFEELARQSTTTAMLYTGIYEDSCEACFQAAQEQGVRVVMGQQLMDLETYTGQQPFKVASVALHESERLLKKWHGAANGLIDYAVSPRFAPTSSKKLLLSAAELAAKHGAYLQLHLAENAEELERIQNLFPDALNYTDVYEKAGLLGPKTILSHAVHVSEKEIEVIAASEAAVAHCPGANLFSNSGIMALERFQRAGIRVGLGSGIGAGPELSIWSVMRSAIEAQRARSFFVPDAKAPTPAEALYLATQGGANALGKGDLIGSFDIGKQADLCVIDIGALLPYRRDPRGEADLSADDILSLCIYRGGVQSVLETFVAGRSIYRSVEQQLF